MDMLFFILLKIATTIGSAVSNFLFKRKLERAATSLMIDDGGKEVPAKEINDRIEKMMNEVLNGQ